MCELAVRVSVRRLCDGEKAVTVRRLCDGESNSCNTENHVRFV